MASINQLAKLYKIKPEILENWANGPRPTNGYYGFLCHEIFFKFDYQDGYWHPKSEIAAQEISSHQND